VGLVAGMPPALPPFVLAVVPGKQEAKSKNIGEHKMNEDKRKYVHARSDVKDNASDNDSDSDGCDERPTRQGTRPRVTCAGRLRHVRDCACGRRRALVRNGHRWQRLAACWRCLGLCKRIGLAAQLKEDCNV
jgi:hypothetical protein